MLENRFKARTPLFASRTVLRKKRGGLPVRVDRPRIARERGVMEGRVGPFGEVISRPSRPPEPTVGQKWYWREAPAGVVLDPNPPSTI